ncbi:MAG: PP2C family protein-serine/threonine phosphatase [Myxococcota bacterium]
MRALALYGRDFPKLGPLGVVALPEVGALALTRGREPKPYRHTDPNEDAALVVVSERGSLFAVADGYNGVSASERAIEAVANAGPDLITLNGERFHQHLEQVLAGLARELVDVGPSRTCLLVAALVEDRCHWACLGDSSLYRAGRDAPVTEENRCVVGPELQLDDAIRKRVLGSFQRGSGERIALVTDGVTNFVADAGLVAERLAAEDAEARCARGIALRAMGDGAGDNIAVAVAAPPS